MEAPRILKDDIDDHDAPLELLDPYAKRQQNELLKVCKPPPKSDDYQIIWYHEKLNLGENRIYLSTFQKLGYSKFKTLANFVDFKDFIENKITKNNVLIVGSSLVVEEQAFELVKKQCSKTRTEFKIIIFTSKIDEYQ